LTDIAEIAVRTAIEIAFAYRNGETSPIALTEYLLERIEKAERDNIFITVTPARARKEAEAAEAAEARYRRRRPLSVLDGVPIAWKDLFDVADAPTTGGSLLFNAKAPKEHDLVCVANAAAAGMVCMGKLNLSETCLFRAGSQSAFRHAGQSKRPQHPPLAWRLLLRLGRRCRRGPRSLRRRH
jgi:aspartyl-tRNA(Asn)/glutamyl-tRNA(Gln) amidotransferase subunit A